MSNSCRMVVGGVMHRSFSHGALWGTWPIALSSLVAITRPVFAPLPDRIATSSVARSHRGICPSTSPCLSTKAARSLRAVGVHIIPVDVMASLNSRVRLSSRSGEFDADRSVEVSIIGILLMIVACASAIVRKRKEGTGPLYVLRENIVALGVSQTK